MKFVVTCLTAYIFIALSLTPTTPPLAAAQLLPESLAARAEQATNQKTFTLFLREDDPVQLTKLVNIINDKYRKKGWSVFCILPYSHNGDVDGFFVTYQKGLVVDELPGNFN
ncbi:MAG: hypothetical protein COA36_00230 [Desulfotalea sp.]|nr:MAG: hypothetical protein COA36_00230 [Desulfotalea sp.]